MTLHYNSAAGGGAPAFGWLRFARVVVVVGVTGGDAVGVVADEAPVVTAASLSRIGRSKPTLNRFRGPEKSMRQAHGSQHLR